MSTNAARRGVLPRGLVLSILGMTVLVLGLGGAILAIKLRPSSLPTGAVDREVVTWQRAVDADPEDASARTGLGLALLQAGRPEDARAQFERAVQLRPKGWVALLQLGVLVGGEDPTRAVALLTDAARYAPRTSKAVPLVAKGDLLLDRGDAEEAKIAYRAAIADVPYLFDAHLGLAQAYEALGDTKKALREFRTAGRFDPGNQEVAAGMARLQGTGSGG